MFPIASFLVFFSLVVFSLVIPLPALALPGLFQGQADTASVHVLDTPAYPAVSASTLDENPTPARYDPTLTAYEVSGVEGEHIDLRTQAVSWETTDLLIPGNGGLDLEVSRSYNRIPFSYQQMGNWVLGLPRIQIPTAPIYLTAAYPEAPWLAYWQEMIGDTSARGLCDGAPYLVPENEGIGTKYAAQWVLHIPGDDARVLMEPDTASTGDAFPATARLLTSDNWIVECIDPLDAAESWGSISWGGYLATSPDGTRYYFDFIYGAMPGDTGLGSHGGWLELVPTKIEDAYGNSLVFEYVPSLVTRNSVSASHLLYRIVGYDAAGNPDGRAVQFTYDPYFSFDPYNFRNFYGWKHSIVSAWVADQANPGQPHPQDRRRIEYEWSEEFVGAMLDRVNLPEGLYWSYSLDADGTRIILPNATDHSPLFALTQVRLPTGGFIDYEYDHGGAVPGTDWQPVRLKKRTTSGPSVEPGQWQYDYELSGHEEITTIASPYRTDRYRFYEGQGTYIRELIRADIDGDNYGFPLDDGSFMGRLREHIVLSPDEVELRRTSYQWESRRSIGLLAYGYQNNSAYPFASVGYYNTRPGYLARTTVTDVMTGSVFGQSVLPEAVNIYGQVTAVTETGVDGSNGESLSRQLYLNYFNTVSPWIVGKPASRRLGQSVPQTWSYTPEGRVSMFSNYGLATFFEYDSNGNLSNRYQLLEGDQKGTTYADYYRGVARLEVAADGGSTSRQVAASGDVLSVTDPVGAETTFRYDLAGRLTHVGMPDVTLADIDIAYLNERQAQLTQGGLTEITTADGFGRLIEKRRFDSFSPDESITQQFRLDAVGRQISVSDPVYPEVDAAETGWELRYDPLDRLLIETDLSTDTAVNFCYSSFCLSRFGVTADVRNGVAVIDERGYVTVREYRSFRSPLQPSSRGAELTGVRQQLRKATEPQGERFVETILQRNPRGQVTGLTQNGLTRDFVFNDAGLLIEEHHPEAAVKHYFYDDIGNLVRLRQADRITDYSYDDVNRLTRISFNDRTPAATYSWRLDGRLGSAASGLVSHSYNYRADGRRSEESIAVQLHDGSEVFEFEYSYDELGHPNGITYPSGETVPVPNDALGRPTGIGNYVSGLNWFADGRIAEMTYANGVSLSQSLAAGRYLDRQDWSDLSGAMLSADYDYDAAGNVVSLTRTGSVEEQISLAYDGLGRLNATDGTWNDNGAAAFTDNGDIEALGGRSFSYEAAKLTSSGDMQLDYDAYGNVTATGEHNFLLNARNMITSVSSLPGTSYMYDAFGRRILAARNNELQYTVFTSAGRLLHAKNATTGTVTDYIYLGPMLVAKNDQPGPSGPVADSDGDWIPDFHEALSGTSPVTDDGEADPDNDGLSNVFEYLGGGNPLSPDTDADGLPDGFEYNFNLGLRDSSDSTADPDNDSLSTIEEYLIGTDPLLADSDADGVPDGLDAAPLVHPATVVMPVILMLLED